MESAKRGRIRVLFYPHAAIAAIFLAWAGGLLRETIALPLFVAAHVALPVWCAVVGGGRSLRQRLFIGPGSLVGFYLALIVSCFLVVRSPDGWIWLLVLITMLAVLASYGCYCLIVFGVAAGARRHRAG